MCQWVVTYMQYVTGALRERRAKHHACLTKLISTQSVSRQIYPANDGDRFTVLAGFLSRFPFLDHEIVYTMIDDVWLCDEN